VKVLVNGAEASKPVTFRRAGVITIAGGPSSTLFGNNLYALAPDSRGNIYVVERSARYVKIIVPDGTVSNLQSNGADLVFGSPSGTAMDRNDRLYSFME
jgi:hypothetical protein